MHLTRRRPDPNGVTPRSPGLPAQRETLGLRSFTRTATPTGLRQRWDATPLGLRSFPGPSTQGLPLRGRPWATRRDPVGVDVLATSRSTDV